VSDILHLRAVRICPAELKSLSTAALLSNAALYLRNAAATRGNAVSEVVSVELHHARQIIIYFSCTVSEWMGTVRRWFIHEVERFS